MPSKISSVARTALAIAVVTTALGAHTTARATPITRSYEIITPLGVPTPQPLPGGQHHPGLEECPSFGFRCAVVYPTGVIELTTDEEVGTASILLRDIVAFPVVTGLGLASGQIAIDLFLGLDGAKGTRSPTAAPFTTWRFEVDDGVFLNVSDLFGRTIEIDGGFDHRPVDGPSAWVNLEAAIVPEPSTAILLLGGLAALAGRSTQRV